MKKSVWLFYGLFLVAILFMVCWPHNSKDQVMSKIKATGTNAPDASSNQIAQPAIAGKQIADDSNAADIADKYNQGLINKDEAMREVFASQNKQPQYYYGKIVDQYGNPISGVDVTGLIVVRGGLGDGAQNQTYTTQSDADGLFEFTGKTGWQLNIVVKKDGYLMGARGEGFKGPQGEETTSDKRAILVMWKLRGAEPLVGSSIEAKIPHDGSSVTFEMATGKISPNGDLRVTLSQFPLEVRTGRERFDWTVKVEIINGGLIEENDPYPYWAPADGYQPSFEFNVSSNAVKWLPNLKKCFYIKNAQGQYAIMQFSIYPGRPPTGLEVNLTINPSGSQNLEPAPEKRTNF